MKKLFSIITLLAISFGAMAQSYVYYEWKDSVSTIRATTDIDSLTFYLPEDLVSLTTGLPDTLKRTSMTSSFSLDSEVSFADTSATEQGICYSAFNSIPTIEDTKVKFGAFNKGVCEITITGLTNGTFYYYRPYLMVADQVYYGPVKTFSTWEGANNTSPAIYETLKSSGNYKYYLRMVADSDEDNVNSLDEILSKPGSKTLFIANDKAWEKFFANNKNLPKSNPWHYAQSYESLSENQKTLLLHSSILHQAVEADQLSTTSDEIPWGGQYLRRYTDVEILDSVTRIAVTDLPKTYWKAERQASEDGLRYPEADQWSRIRNGGLLGYDSIYMVQDTSPVMMVHLTEEYMKSKSITDEDFRIIMGQERSSGDVHIFDARIDSADIVCENGYVNITSKPLVPTANMAEMIRTNGRTNIYSHLLERFSVPFQNKTLGNLYSKKNPDFSETDTLYTKHYYSRRSYKSSISNDYALTSNEQGELFGEIGDAILKFDPGWNGYYPSGATAQEDMGAMFVPNDKQLLDYFNNGGGKTFLEEYTLGHHAGQYTLDNLNILYEDIDQIPLRVISAILNHGMMNSFVWSVPSKMLNLREIVSTEKLFRESDTRLTKEGGTIDTVLVACNGAVYIMNNLFMPSDFNSVASPAYIGSNNNIMRWAIYSDYNGQIYMGLNYWVYLKTMENQISFFMPDDEAMQYYYDPMSFTSRFPRVMRFMYTPGKFPFATKSSNGVSVLAGFDVETGTIGRDLNTQTTNQTEIINRLRQMLEHHTIVHKGTINTINTDEDEYYLSKNGMGMRVIRDENGITKVQGGFQAENEREGLQHNHPGILYCNVTKKGDFKNGWNFTLDAPIIPAARSVFSVLSGMERGKLGEWSDYNEDYIQQNNPYREFFKLCNDFIYDIVLKSGLIDENDPKYDTSTSQGINALNKAISKYQIFVDNNAVDYNVRFFNNYNYTVFAPTNEAIIDAVNRGLPTWESIMEDYESCIDESGNLNTHEDSMRIQAKIVCLTNFIRMHFADKSVFADKSELETDLYTNSYNRDKGVFCKVMVQRVKEGGETILKVKDSTGNWINTVYTYGGGQDVKNIMTCDRECNVPVKHQPMNNKTTEASSYAVVHLINGVLNHEGLNSDGTYPTFDNPNSARQYIKRFSIR